MTYTSIVQCANRCPTMFSPLPLLFKKLAGTKWLSQVFVNIYIQTGSPQYDYLVNLSQSIEGVSFFISSQSLRRLFDSDSLQCA